MPGWGRVLCLVQRALNLPREVSPRDVRSGRWPCEGVRGTARTKAGREGARVNGGVRIGSVTRRGLGTGNLACGAPRSSAKGHRGAPAKQAGFRQPFSPTGASGFPVVDNAAEIVPFTQTILQGRPLPPAPSGHALPPTTPSSYLGGLLPLGYLEISSFPDPLTQHAGQTGLSTPVCWLVIEAVATKTSPVL